jgi:uncharacterized protein YbjT (DUF2867 family)
MTALLAGATGLIGREVARHWRGRGRLHLLVRRAPAEATQSAHTVHVVDFAALPPLPQAEEACCCLGTTIKVAGSQTGFRAVDFDAVLEFARAARAAGVRRFAAVSALGADSKSSNFYSRVKGEMEEALEGVGFASLVIARPSLLAGDRAALGQPARAGEALALAFTRPLGRLIPAVWRPIEAACVARAMLRALAEGRPGTRILTSGEMQELGQERAPRQGR